MEDKTVKLFEALKERHKNMSGVAFPCLINEINDLLVMALIYYVKEREIEDIEGLKERFVVKQVQQFYKKFDEWSIEKKRDL